MIILAVVIVVAAYIIRSEVKNRRWIRAFDLRKEMFNKYIELTEDPLVSEEELKKWLPKFDEADEICARDCPDMKFSSIGHRLRRFLYKDELSSEEFLKD